MVVLNSFCINRVHCVIPVTVYFVTLPALHQFDWISRKLADGGHFCYTLTDSYGKEIFIESFYSEIPIHLLRGSIDDNENYQIDDFNEPSPAIEKQ